MTSIKYRMWMTIDDSKRCPDCKRLHGKIYHWNEPIISKQPLRLFGRCCVAWLRSLLAGTATKQDRTERTGGLRITASCHHITYL